MINKRKQPFA